MTAGVRPYLDVRSTLMACKEKPYSQQGFHPLDCSPYP